MPGSIAAIKDLFCNDDIRHHLDERLAAHSLPTLGEGRPILRHRLQLASAAALPALAVELGEVDAGDVGAGGLRALRGVATLWFAVGRADEAGLLAQIEGLIDALREAVETGLAGEFQRLTFAGAAVEGVPWRDGPVPLRLVPVRFRFEWLYDEGEF